MLAYIPKFTRTRLLLLARATLYLSVAAAPLLAPAVFGRENSRQLEFIIPPLIMIFAGGATLLAIWAALAPVKTIERIGAPITILIVYTSIATAPMGANLEVAYIQIATIINWFILVTAIRVTHKPYNIHLKPQTLDTSVMEQTEQQYSLFDMIWWMTILATAFAVVRIFTPNVALLNPQFDIIAAIQMTLMLLFIATAPLFVVALLGITYCLDSKRPSRYLVAFCLAMPISAIFGMLFLLMPNPRTSVMTYVHIFCFLYFAFSFISAPFSLFALTLLSFRLVGLKLEKVLKLPISAPLLSNKLAGKVQEESLPPLEMPTLSEIDSVFSRDSIPTFTRHNPTISLSDLDNSAHFHPKLAIEGHVFPGVPRLQAWLLLLVVLHLVVTVVVAACYHWSINDRFANTVAAMALLGVGSAQLALLAIWSAFGTSHPLRRLVSTLGMMFVIILLGTLVIENRHVAITLQWTGVISSLLMLGTLWFAHRRSKIRLIAPEVSAEGNSRKHWLTVAELAGCLFGIGTLAIFSRLTTFPAFFFDSDYGLEIPALFFFVFIVYIFLGIASTAASFALVFGTLQTASITKGLRQLTLALLFSWSVAVGIILAIIFPRGVSITWSHIVFVIAAALPNALLMLGTAFFFRLLGIHAVRVARVMPPGPAVLSNSSHEPSSR